MKLTLIAVLRDAGTFGGEFWLVAEGMRGLGRGYGHRLYACEPLAAYGVESNAGGDDELTPGAVITVDQAFEAALGDPLSPERLAAFLSNPDNPY